MVKDAGTTRVAKNSRPSATPQRGSVAKRDPAWRKPALASNFKNGRRAKTIRNLEGASPRDVKAFPGVLKSFKEYLAAEYGPTSPAAAQYGQTFQRMFRMFQKSIKAMTSVEFVQALRGMKIRAIYVSTAKAFCKSKGLIPDGGVTSADSCGLKRTYMVNGAATGSWTSKTEQLISKIKALRKFEDASAEDIDSFASVCKAFKEYLAEKHGPSSPATLQYGQVFVRMFNVFKKSTKAMSSIEFVEAVKAMQLRSAYVATAKAFCEFNGIKCLRGKFPLPDDANAEAKKRFGLAIQHGRPVADADVLAVLRLWPFTPNTKRKNVMPKKTDWVYSSTLGLIHDFTGRVVVSLSTCGSEDVVRLLARWLRDQLGENSFPWTSISLNKNYAAARHRDKGNRGPSALRALGDHAGGQLRYWERVSSTKDLSRLSESESVVLDPRHGLVLFDGNSPHSVEPYTGERYSLVFFTTSRYKKATPKVRKQMKCMGLRLPTEIELSVAAGLVREGLGLRG